jgi:poly-gamma-glutamate system protein
MKRLYWRPQKASKHGLMVITLLALFGLALVLKNPTPPDDAQQLRKWTAARRAAAMFESVKQERLRRGLAIEPGFDPAQTGLVGNSMSLVTSRPSDIRSKQTSINPNFAAAIVDMLVEAGVRPGDTVAVGWTGSFPAFNICVSAALESLEARPLIIASATASQYGANLPEWMWLDMERHLRKQGLTSCRSSATTVGGGADRGLGMPAEAIEHVQQTARRNGIPILPGARRAEAVAERMVRYRELAAGQPIKAYINVGGGVASTGGEQGKHLFQSGLNQLTRGASAEVDCVMGHFCQQGVPVIHMNQAKDLAESLGFPIAPTRLPAVGQGRPFTSQQPNRWLASLVLVGVLCGMRLCVWNGQWQSTLRRAVPRFRPQPRPAIHRIEERVREPQLMV